MADKEVFMSVTPRSKQYIGCNIKGIPLRVVQGDGVKTTPDIKFKLTDLNEGVKHFKNNSGINDSFTVTVLLNENDTVVVDKEFDDWSWQEVQLDYDTIIEVRSNGNGVHAKLGNHVKIIDVLDYYMRKGEPFYVTTRAVGIDGNDMYVITANGDRKQNYDDGYVLWDLTFTKYTTISYAVFQNTNAAVTKALNNYKNQQTKNKKKSTTKKKTKAKSKTTTKSKLKKCKLSQIKYSKKKKTTNCVKYMQTILWNKKFLTGKKKEQIDGWYGKSTKAAVKKFQKKYKKKYKLKVNGTVDSKTLKALYTV